MTPFCLPINMAKFYIELNLINVITVSLVLSSFCLPQPQHFITTCLIDHHATNFSLNPTSPNHFNSSSYYNLLFSSLQNLRFTEPKYPKPFLIVLPRSKEQLVSSLMCFKKGGYEVRIRCGGHSYEGLSSITNGGKPFVIIDLMNLDQVVVDLRLKTAWVEGGATLGQVYYTIAVESKGEYGFSGGSCPTVGSGGHFSGGGFGLLSRKFGLAADNVVDALLVDPAGRVLDRAAMGEDVFWAIRGGGGGSFGIVYAWKIKLLKVPARVTTIQASREGKIWNISKLVHKWQYVGPFLNDKFYLSVSIGANVNGNNTSIATTFTGQFLGQKHEAISIMKDNFPQLGVKEGECNEMSWIESVLYFSGLNEGSTISDLKNRNLQSKSYYKAKSDYVRTPIPIEGVRGAMNILAKEPKGYIIMDPYGGEMARIPKGSIAFPHRQGNLYSIQYMVSWDQKNDPKKNEYIAWIRGFYDFMAPFVSSNPRAAYINYLDLDLGGRDDEFDSGDGGNDVGKSRVWGEKYFLTNYDRLVNAKTIIDPCNFFSHPQGIPPKSLGSHKHCPLS